MAETREPLALLVKGRQPEEIVAYACGTCGIVARTEQEARDCHGPARCGDCGAPTDRRWSKCGACHAKERAAFNEREAAKEQALYEKARKIPLAEYDGAYLYWPDATGGDGGEGYFSEVGTLLEHCGDDGVDPPDWVWACSPVRLTFDAADLVSRACEEQEMHEEASEDVGAAAEKDLQAFLDAWVEKHSPTSYTPHYGLAVDISAEAAAWRTEQASDAP